MKNTDIIDFDEFVTTINEKGKKEALILARDKYNLSFGQIRRRMFKLTDYYFDSSLKIYCHKKQITSIGSEFMTIEGLNMRKHKDTNTKLTEPLTGNVINLILKNMGNSFCH